MKTIVFRGYLHDMYPAGIKVEGDTAMECMTALQGFPGFRENDGMRHTVILPEFGSRDALCSKTTNDTIHVVPILAGAGGKAGQLLMIAVGVVLIATGWGAGVGIGALTASNVTSIGVMLVLNGVIGLLMPQPEVSKSQTEEKSNYLSANRNTVKIGTRIPLLYGRRRVWGHFLSFNVTAGNKVEPTAPDAIADGAFNFTADSDYNYTVESGSGPG